MCFIILHTTHEPYYRDRLTERDLCHDFPADEIFIDGLYAMQSHFCTHNVPIDIPVVRVMNAAHFMLAYAFSNECSGDQMEYDALTYGSVGHDKKVMLVTLIVLAAMLKRTDGFRAQNCRNLIIENREPDFDYGVTLYDQFLRSAKKRFAEEEFLIDTHAQILKLQEENSQLTSENIQLKYTLTKMESQQNNQYNNCVIYNAPVYNTSTTNNYYQQAQTEPDKPAEDAALSEKDQVDTTNKAKSATDYQNILPIPRKGKYTEVRRYIEERCKFDQEFKTFIENHSRVELCMRLTDEFGWDVDEHALGVNMNRNR